MKRHRATARSESLTNGCCRPLLTAWNRLEDEKQKLAALREAYHREFRKQLSLGESDLETARRVMFEQQLKVQLLRAEADRLRRALPQLDADEEPHCWRKHRVKKSCSKYGARREREKQRVRSGSR